MFNWWPLPLHSCYILYFCFWFEGIEKQEQNKSTNSNITAAGACGQVGATPESPKVETKSDVASSQVEGEPDGKKTKITPARAGDQVEAAPDSTKPKINLAAASGHIEGNSGVKATFTPAGDNEKSKTVKNKEKRMRSKKRKNGGDRKKAKRIICEVCGALTLCLENYEHHVRINHS